MSRTLLAVTFSTLILLSSNEVRSQQYLTTHNAYVTAQVSHDGWGLVTIYRTGSTPEESGITYPNNSFLTVLVSGQYAGYYTNNPNLPDTAPPATPAAPTGLLDSGTDVLHPGPDGIDTIETTWSINSAFDIVQDVYPVTFPNGGHIVLSVRIVSHTATALTAQAQYLLDVDIITSASSSNDNAKIATDLGYTTNWEYFDHYLHNDFPHFFMAFEHDLGSVNFPGEVATGFLSDSDAPMDLGLIPPSLVSVVSWETIVQTYTWGSPITASGRLTDEAMLLQWPPVGLLGTASKDSVGELARTSYGLGGYEPCNGIFDAYSFYRYTSHITPFAVTSLIFNPSTSQSYQNVKATLMVDSNFRILGPLPIYGDSSWQTQLIAPTMSPASELTAQWTDSLVRSAGDTTSHLRLAVTYGPQPDSAISSCGLPIVPLRQADITAPLIVTLSRSGSSNGSLCNTRCYDFVTIDSGLDQTGISVITSDSMQNMQLSIAGRDTIGGAEKYFSVCVIDSMLDGAGTIYCVDAAGNTDSIHLVYCTIPDTLVPRITEVSGNGAINLSIVDDRPWDRGLGTVRILTDSNLTTQLTPNNYHGLSGVKLTAYENDTTLPSELCIEVYDLAANKIDTCFTIPAGAKQSVSEDYAIQAPTLTVTSLAGEERITILQPGNSAPMGNVKVFDLLGREVTQFHVNGSYDWRINSLASGTYILRVEIGGTVIIKKIDL